MIILIILIVFLHMLICHHLAIIFRKPIYHWGSSGQTFGCWCPNVSIAVPLALAVPRVLWCNLFAGMWTWKSKQSQNVFFLTKRCCLVDDIFGIWALKEQNTLRRCWAKLMIFVLIVMVVLTFLIQVGIDNITAESTWVKKTRRNRKLDTKAGCWLPSDITWQLSLLPQGEKRCWRGQSAWQVSARSNPAREIG